MIDIEKLEKNGWKEMPSKLDFVKGNLLLSFFKRLKTFQLFDMEKREFLNVKTVEEAYGQN